MSHIADQIYDADSNVTANNISRESSWEKQYSGTKAPLASLRSSWLKTSPPGEYQNDYNIIVALVSISVTFPSVTCRYVDIVRVVLEKKEK